MELLDLCYDVLIRILEEIDPADLAACARTSWSFRNFVTGNRLLYKTHYLKNFDDPRHEEQDTEPAWEAELQKLIKCQKILGSQEAEIKRENFKFVSTTVESLLRTATEIDGQSRNRDHLIDLFEQPRNQDPIFHRSTLFKRAGTKSQVVADTVEDRQASAKLHCLYGVPQGPIGRRSLSTHPYARSHVYDLRNYTDSTRWGPFRDDNSMKVDWEMLEAIMIVLGYNSGICCQRLVHRFRPVWCEPFAGIITNKRLPEYPSTLPNEPEIPLDMKDPFNISGIWLRIVCFLDYTDLHDFNFSREKQVPSDQPREPITTEEAIRHIVMRFKVTKVEAPGQFDNPALPIVHFKGHSQSMNSSFDPNANSGIRGTVRLTDEGEVRWTTISVFYGGEERWRSEGIQVGGPRSARGVIGTWFDKDYDAHGPAGPTAYWKMEGKNAGFEVDEDSSDEEWETI